MVIYRKWRPAMFSDVVGQPHIVKTLKKQLQTGQLAHAYLFTGSRGTGKTTCAKILARAVNCERPAGGEPCNACPTCLGILNDTIPDVAEIDAASNSGVDNIRALREELVYSPVSAKLRVYIIDEVHMLSTGAFNALLKTLEEPPPHVLFILATTETHKVPATIVSRCQRFAFRRIAAEDIAERLRLICSAEGVQITPSALSLIAHLADGALRDAQSLLEQCISSGTELDEDTVRELLGLTGLNDLAQWLFEFDDLSASMRRLNELYYAGLDFAVILAQLSSLLRDLLMGQMLKDLSITRLPEETASALSGLWPKERILFALSHLQETINRLPRSFDKRLEAEMCFIRLASPAVTPRTAPQPAPQPAPSAAQTSAPAAPPPPPKKKESVPQKPAVQPDTNPAEPAAAYPAKNSAGGLADAVRDPRWAGFTASLNPLLRDAFSKVTVKADNDRLIVITDDHFLTGLLQTAGAQVKEHFPKGLSLLSDSAPHSESHSASVHLDTLVQLAGDLIIEE